MALESIGGVSVSIEGDIAPLRAAFATAQASAQQAGAGVASAFNGAAGTVGALDNAASGTAASMAKLNAVMTQTGAASHVAVTEIQAVSGTLRTLDGNGGIRAAERFLTMIPGLGPALQMAFPVIGAIALAEVIGRTITKFRELGIGAGDTEQKIRDAFGSLNLAAQTSNEALQVTNDRLANEIAKIEGKPVNGIKIALDEAREAADRFAASLDKDLTSLTKLLGEQKVGMFRQILGESDTSDINAEIQGFQSKIAKLSTKSNIPGYAELGGMAVFDPVLLAHQKEAAQLATNTALTEAYANELVKLNHLLQTAEGPGAMNPQARIEMLRGAIANLTQQSQSVGLNATNVDLKDAKASAEARREAAEAAKAALAKQEAAIRAAYALMLDDQKSSDRMSIGEEIDFWQARLAELAQGGRKFADYQHQIQNTIGKLYLDGAEETDQAREKDLKEEAAYQEKLVKIKLDWAKAANDSLTALHKSLTEGQAKPSESRPEIPQAAIIGTAATQLAGTAVGNQIALQNAGVQTVAVQRAQIDQQHQIMALMQATNQPVAEQLDMRQKILESEIALGKMEGANTNRAQMELNRLKTRQQLNQIGQAIPGQLGGGLASGVMGGDIGKQIKQSLQGIGHEILGTVFTAAIQKLTLELGINTAATAAMNAIFGIHTAAVGVNTAATSVNAVTTAVNAASTDVNTSATTLNTFWLAIKSFFGFAEGGSPPVGVPSIVGERGPELFVPREAGVIVPNHALGAFGGGGAFPLPSVGASSSVSQSSGDQHFTFHVNGARDTRETVRAIATYLKNASPKFSPHST